MLAAHAPMADAWEDSRPSTAAVRPSTCEKEKATRCQGARYVQHQARSTSSGSVQEIRFPLFDELFTFISQNGTGTKADVSLPVRSKPSRMTPHEGTAGGFLS